MAPWPGHRTVVLSFKNEIQALAGICGSFPRRTGRRYRSYSPGRTSKTPIFLPTADGWLIPRTNLDGKKSSCCRIRGPAENIRYRLGEESLLDGGGTAERYSMCLRPKA